MPLHHHAHPAAVEFSVVVGQPRKIRALFTKFLLRVQVLRVVELGASGRGLFQLGEGCFRRRVVVVAALALVALVVVVALVVALVALVVALVDVVLVAVLLELGFVIIRLLLFR